MVRLLIQGSSSAWIGGAIGRFVGFAPENAPVVRLVVYKPSADGSSWFRGSAQYSYSVLAGSGVVDVSDLNMSHEMIHAIGAAVNKVGRVLFGLAWGRCEGGGRGCMALHGLRLGS
jgi:hypothetical protein